MFAISDRKSRWLAVLALAVVVWAAWGGALQCWFASDDFLWLDIARPGPSFASFASDVGVKFDFHPVTRLLLLLDWELWGMQPWGWHLVNLLLHLGCAVLAWRLFLLWFPAPLALAGALLFAVNPVLPENTVWISGMTGSLSTLLGLVSVLCFERWLRQRRGWLLALSVAADLAAVASYEPLCILPFAHAALCLRQKSSWRGLVLLCACHAAVLAWRGYVLRDHSFDPGPAYHLQTPTLHNLVRTARGYWAFHVFFLVLPWLLAPGFLALLLPRHRGLAQAALIILAAMMVALAPYAVFNSGAGSRYFYTACIGLGGLEAISLFALASLLPKFLRLPVFAVLCLLVLRAETQRARAETQDWIAAGQLGQQLMAALQSADPSPQPEALHILLDVPTSLGNGELFTTYPDHAFRRFTRSPFDALMVLPQYGWRTGKAELFFLQKRQNEEDEYRIAQHRPPLSCLDRALSGARDLESYVRNAEPCGIDALEFHDGKFTPLTPDQFWQWYGKNGKRVQGA